MLSIVLLGTGNVAEHLYHAFSLIPSVKVVQVYGRNTHALSKFSLQTAVTTSFENIATADLYLIAVSDGSITEVSKRLHVKGIVAHTSGSVSIKAIDAIRRGVFYPLQTFTKGKMVTFKTIPIGIETENENDAVILTDLAKKLSNSVHYLSSEQREYLHIAAVFSNNFVNHLYQISEQICNGKKIPFDLLKPLIQETAEKINAIAPNDAQTGPAIRNDIAIIEKHLDELSNPIHKKLYQLLSESIISTHEKKL